MAKHYSPKSETALLRTLKDGKHNMSYEILFKYGTSQRDTTLLQLLSSLCLEKRQIGVFQTSTLENRFPKPTFILAFHSSRHANRVLSTLKIHTILP